MKKWLGLLLLSCSLQVMANDTDEICEGTAEFGGEVLELRHAGVGRDTALNLVTDVLKDTRGEERIIAGQLLNLVVNSVYDVDLNGLESASEAEIQHLKNVFVTTMVQECKAAMQ